MADSQPKNVIELLEEDDEFEEFESKWNVTADAEDQQLWLDDWDDDDVSDEFSEQLRQRIEKVGSAQDSSAQQS